MRLVVVDNRQRAAPASRAAQERRDAGDMAYIKFGGPNAEHVERRVAGLQVKKYIGGAWPQVLVVAQVLLPSSQQRSAVR